MLCHCYPKATVDEEANPEELSATVEDFNGHADVNSSNVEPSVGVEENPINEITVSELPAEVTQELKVEEVAAAAVPALIADELLTTEGPVDYNIFEGPQPESEPEGVASDRLEDLSQTDIRATDETVPLTGDCEATETDIGATEEPLELTPDLATEQPEVLEPTESSLITSSISITETEEAGQMNVSEEPKYSVETPESK